MTRQAARPGGPRGRAELGARTGPRPGPGLGRSRPPSGLGPRALRAPGCPARRRTLRPGSPRSGLLLSLGLALGLGLRGRLLLLGLLRLGRRLVRLDRGDGLRQRLVALHLLPELAELGLLGVRLRRLLAPGDHLAEP